MPRSGTTLVEQIISSHKDVLPTGENDFLSSFIKFNYLNGFSLNGKKVTKDIFSKENSLQITLPCKPEPLGFLQKPG